MNRIRSLYPTLILALFGIVVALYMLQLPGLLAFHETYQFFLFSQNYFKESISVAGGVSDYIAEFIVQFFYYPAVGAVIVAIIIILLTATLYYTLKRESDEWPFSLSILSLSISISVFLLAFMCDENAMFTFPVALTLSILIVRPLRYLMCGLATSIVTIVIATPLLYWIIGPVSVVAIVISIITEERLRRRYLISLVSLLYIALTILVLGRLFLEQYPNESLFWGVHYYRQPTQFPTSLFGLPLYIVIGAIAINVVRSIRLANSILFTSAFSGGVLLLAVLSVLKSFDGEKFTTLQYINLTRQGAWQRIIENSKDEQPDSELSRQCVMLALAKTGQMGEQMFNYNLRGVQDLFDRFKLNCVSATPSAEVAYHLALVNTCFRYYFDSQEAIPNGKKSAHMTKRMAECLIVNGKYNAARKYLERLKRTIFYSDWAKKTEIILDDEKSINEHPVFGEMRRLRFKTENFFFYDQIETEFGLLALEDGAGSNRLAWDYFCAVSLLKGNLERFVGMYHYASEVFQQEYIPLHHQEAILLFWSFGHPNTEGLPFPISQAVVKNLQNFISNTQKNQNYWKVADPSYWTYYLMLQNKKSQRENRIPIHNEREG
ncbi:MAG: hypothetical protein HUJ96_01030 [Marinilabiliaceae bacterium]|nr:hypothetical protein [Marinilabiliaceae bacterium]